MFSLFCLYFYLINHKLTFAKPNLSLQFMLFAGTKISPGQPHNTTHPAVHHNTTPVTGHHSITPVVTGHHNITHPVGLQPVVAGLRSIPVAGALRKSITVAVIELQVGLHALLADSLGMLRPCMMNNWY